MSLIKDYMSERRKKKLAEITQALEQLKHENVATDSLKPKTTLSTATSYTPMRAGKDFLFIGILLLCVVVLVVVSFYYRNQYTTLNSDYQAKVDKLKTLEADLAEREQELEDTQDLLKDKEDAEKRLSGTKETLEEEIADLEDQIETLEADIITKRTEIDNLTRTINQQRGDINYWKDCIEDELNQNLSVCD